VVKRRSLDDALTPEEEAFVKSGRSKPKPETNPKPQPEKKEETPMPRPIALKESFTHEAAPPVQPQKSPPPGQSHAGIASINARIDPAITGALIRASVEQRLAGKTPSTQREIIAEALTDWLKKNGFWK
jgi:hypothetical protein